MTKIKQMIITALSVFLLTTSAYAEGMTHKIAVHVDQNNKKVMNLALNNVQNLTKYYASKGDKVIVEIVTYGPGLHMLRSDTSPVKDRIETMSMAMPNLKFSACANTQRKMMKKSGKDVPLLSEASKVPSGVVQLIALQEKGYSYIKP
jgi:uncharacterized protein